MGRGADWWLERLREKYSVCGVRGGMEFGEAHIFPFTAPSFYYGAKLGVQCNPWRGSIWAGENCDDPRSRSEERGVRQPHSCIIFFLISEALSAR